MERGAFSDRPVAVDISYPAGTDRSVSMGQSAIFTFTVTGAVFAEDISGGDLAFRAGADDTLISGVTFSEGRNGGGGQRGDNFVSYTVTATADAGITLSTNSVSNYFRFLVPDLEMVTVADGETLDDRRIMITATVDPPAASRFGNAGSNFPKFPASSPTTDHMATIAFIDPAYSLSITPSSMSTTVHSGQISLEDETMFTATTTNPVLQINGFGDSAESGVLVSSVRVMNRRSTSHVGDHKIADADTVFMAGTTDLLQVVVRGNFSQSDRLFLAGPASGNSVTYDEDDHFLLTISEDGMTAEGSARLSGTTGNITVGDPYALYYVPSGTISRGAIASSYTLNFAAATARDTTMAAKDLTLEYSGINYTNYAYAVPHPDAADAGNLRVRCEGASPCTIFFRCRDEGGNDVGSFARTMLGAGATRRLSSADLLEMIGGNWPRRQRLACSIHSSSRVAVQLLVRSGGTLTNNSFVGGLEAIEPPPAASN